MLTPLSPTDIPDILGLQDAVWKELQELGKTRFIVPRQHEYFATHLLQPHKVVGIRNDEGRLIAQAVHHNAQPFNIIKETGLPLIDGLLETHLVTTLQGALVHPLNRKQGLMGQLIADWLESSRNMQFALARIEVSHEASRAAFIKAGFNIIGTVEDARDDASVHVLLKQLL